MGKKITSIELHIEWEESGMTMEATARTFVPDNDSVDLARSYAESAETFGTNALKLIRKISKGVESYSFRDATVSLYVFSGSTYGSGRETLPGSMRWCYRFNGWDRRTWAPSTYGGSFPEDVDDDGNKIELDAAALIKSVSGALAAARKDIIRACWDVAMDAARQVG